MVRVVARSSEAPAVDRTYRCGAAARWLPRALGGAVLLALTLMGLEVSPEIVRILPLVRQLVVAAGALSALLIVRHGAEVRHVFGLAPDAMVVGHERTGARLEYADLARLDWSPPLSGSLAWIPAAVLVDRQGKAWRVPALLSEGDEMMRGLLARARRDDLDEWAAAYRIVERMARYRLRIRIGYAVTTAVAAVGVAHWIS